MNNTRILEPMQYDNDRTKANAILIFETFEHWKYDDSCTFDRFLANLKLSHADYIHALQCSLKVHNNIVAKKTIRHMDK